MGFSAAGWAAIASTAVSAAGTIYTASQAGKGSGGGSMMSAPAPTAAPAAPTMDSAATGNAAADEERRRRAGMGRSSTIMTELGDTGGGMLQSARKTLLGS